jgi:hypothetical protein
MPFCCEERIYHQLLPGIFLAIFINGICFLRRAELSFFYGLSERQPLLLPLDAASRADVTWV